MNKKNKEKKNLNYTIDILPSDTMRCNNCNSVIGCFAGPPLACPVCGKLPYGGGRSLKKLFGRKK